MRVLAAVASLLLGLPAIAGANGAPLVPGPQVGPHGPRQPSSVRLVEEELALDLDEASYAAVATYWLHNPGPPVTLEYGVPVDHPGEGAWGEPSGEREATARTIAVSVAPRSEGGSPPAKAWRASPPCVLGPRDEKTSRTWCVTTVRIPSGDALLRLTYQSSLEYSGGSTSKSPVDSRSDSTLEYDLAPAGFWAGPVERVRVAISAGPVAEHLVLLSPKGWARAGDTFRLTLERPDLRASPPIRAVVRVAAREHHRQVVGLQPLPGPARASSALKPQGRFTFGAEHVLDGKPETAWCEGRPGPGVGEWIEVPFESGSGRGCPLHGFVFTPGYVRDQATWLRNGRPVKVSLSPCGGKGTPADFDVALPERFDESAILLVNWDLTLSSLEAERTDGRLYPPDPQLDPDAAPQGYCVRLTLLDVKPGADPDACVSEFRPVFNCN